MKIGILSTYPPRECGIATFAIDVMKGIAQADPSVSFVVCAISDQEYEYSGEVAFKIRQQVRSDYRAAADFFNSSDVDLVLVQHEFGIFGGYNGSYLLDFVTALTKPVAIAFHTIPMHPAAKRRTSRLTLLRKLCECADATFVIIPSAKTFLKSEHFSASVLQRIHVVPHGAPMVSASMLARRETIRRDLNIPSTGTMVLTYGLITQKKGIHHAIRALRQVVKRHPNMTYVIAGRMHPSKADSYLSTLQQYVQEHQLEEHVRFITKYLLLDEILELLVASDVYLVPYLTKGQVSSGTLAYAVAAGKAIISTPFVYAADVLSNNRGILVDFSSSSQIATALSRLTEDVVLRTAIANNARAYGKHFAWKRVGKQYLDTLKKIAK